MNSQQNSTNQTSQSIIRASSGRPLSRYKSLISDQVSNITKGKPYQQLQKSAPKELYKSLLPILKKLTCCQLKKYGSFGAKLNKQIKIILSGSKDKYKKNLSNFLQYIIILGQTRKNWKQNEIITDIHQAISKHIDSFLIQKVQMDLNFQNIESDEAEHTYWLNIRKCIENIGQLEYEKILKIVWGRQQINRSQLYEKYIQSIPKMKEKARLWIRKHRHLYE